MSIINQKIYSKRYEICFNVATTEYFEISVVRRVPVEKPSNFRTSCTSRVLIFPKQPKKTPKSSPTKQIIRDQSLRTGLYRLAAGAISRLSRGHRDRLRSPVATLAAARVGLALGRVVSSSAVGNVAIRVTGRVTFRVLEEERVAVEEEVVLAVDGGVTVPRVVARFGGGDFLEDEVRGFLQFGGGVGGDVGDGVENAVLVGFLEGDGVQFSGNNR